MKCEHISVSRDNTLKTCPWQYRYKYHLQAKPTEAEPFHFIYGKIVHKIAEEYVRAKGDRPIAEITIDILQRKIPIDRNENNPVFAPKLPRDYQARLPNHINSIKVITEQIGWDGFLEHEFRYDLEPPNQKFIKGFIDRVIQRDNEWFILDYKTTKKGKWRKTQANIVDDIQLRIYSRVIQKTFNVPAENIRAALLYLDEGELVAAKFTQESLVEAEQYLLNSYNTIVNMSADDAPAIPGDHCRHCMFKSMCPFYKKDNDISWLYS